MRKRRSLALLVAGMYSLVLPPQMALSQSFGGDPPTATPIQHLVVIFQENVSFDHYFAVYPNAANPPGEPSFKPAHDTPTVNGFNNNLLTLNPNFLNTANNSAGSAGAVNPFRLDRSQAATADQDHNYGPEQTAFDRGLMDLFPLSVGVGGIPAGSSTGLVMGYYDGNTVTGLWNYAQHFAMSDNSWDTTFGPSTPGALNLVSGQTNGVIVDQTPEGNAIDGGNGSLTDIGDADPVGDVCSNTTFETIRMGGPNIGDLLTAANVTWGFFEGGFDLGIINANGTTGCKRSTTSAVTNVTKVDYIPHHQPFQYYASTANFAHTRPSSMQAIGTNGDAANHQYDIHDFFDALAAGNMPSVAFLKASGFQDGHAGYSDPLDEQTFIVNTINTIERSPFWNSTAIVISYDDSDGWYDHQMSPIVNQSSTSADALTGPGSCGNGSFALPGIDPGNAHAQGRCAYGPRLPLLVISPFARENFVDHGVTDQVSAVRFAEDNWLHGARLGKGSLDAISNSIASMLDFSPHPLSRRLFLNPVSGEQATP